MFKKILMVAVLGFVLSFGVACGDDDDAATADFTGALIDYLSKVPVQGLTVTVLDNVTGAPLPGFDPVVSGTGEINVTFTGLPVGKVGFKVDAKAGTPGTEDTYQFNIDSSAQGETLYSIDSQTYAMAPAAAGLTLDPTKAQVGGGFYWIKPDGEECPVCNGTVEAYTGGTQSGEIRYINDQGLPATLETLPAINETNGFYLAANLDPGAIEMRGLGADGAKVGSSVFPAFANSFTISNIHVDEGATANPGTCEDANCQ